MKVHTLLKLLFWLLIIYLGLHLYALIFADKQMFFPPPPGYKDSPNILKIKVADKAIIAAIYLPNTKAKYTILLSHGNAEDIGYMLPFLTEFNKHGFAIFAYDYQGYGLSTGTPTEKHCYQDVAAAYNYLTNTLKVPANRIIGYGNSIGAAVTIDLATKRPLAGVIAQSPFISAFRVVTHIPLLLFDKFNNLAKIGHIYCPLLIIHGTKDWIVPIWHGKKLFQHAKQPKYHLWIKNAGHNDLISVAGGKYWQALQKFVNN